MYACINCVWQAFLNPKQEFHGEHADWKLPGVHGLQGDEQISAAEHGDSGVQGEEQISRTEQGLHGLANEQGEPQETRPTPVGQQEPVAQ